MESHLMSSSLKVVSIALVFCASLRRCAIFSRMRFILTLCSERVPAISFVGSSGGILTMGAGPEAGDAAAAGVGRIADTGVSEMGAVGIGGAGGGVVGAGPDAAAGGGGGGGGGAAAAASSCIDEIKP